MHAGGMMRLKLSSTDEYPCLAEACRFSSLVFCSNSDSGQDLSGYWVESKRPRTVSSEYHRKTISLI